MDLLMTSQKWGLSMNFCAVSKDIIDLKDHSHISCSGIIKSSCSRTSSKASHNSLQLQSRTFFLEGRHLQQPRVTNWSYHRKYLIFASRTAAEGGVHDAPEDFRVSGVDSNRFTSLSGQCIDLDDAASLRATLLAAEDRVAAAEREKADALEALAKAEAKQQEYGVNLVQTTAAAMQEIESAREIFNKELEMILEEKLAVESELVLAKQDAIDLAVKVEMLAESAIQEATANLAEEAQLRIAAAEASAAEASEKVDNRIRIAAIDAADSMLKESRDVIEKSFTALEAAKEKAQKAEVGLFQKMQILDDLVLKEVSALGLQQAISTLQQQLQAAKNENERLRAEIKAVMVRAETAEACVSAAGSAMQQSQATARKSEQEHEQKTKNALEALKNAGEARLEAAKAVFKADIDAFQAAVNTLSKANKAQEQANIRKYEALERSLVTAEVTARAWKERAVAVEDLLRKIKEQAIETEVSGTMLDELNGGRIITFLGSDSRKWHLLANGPRRETPDWMLRRIKVALQGLPPRKTFEGEAETEIHLQLPTSEDTWSIASAKVKEDIFTREAAEKETIDKQRRALEHALQRKTVRRPKEAEIKIESGTGSGREIVFQGFNWESWRRKWYLELESKAADLANCGITAIWFPPPTHSVSAQGYMPGDLYDLNSAYGSLGELKHCIEVMHNHDLLVLGDTVLNHRCAQKKSPNGVWNIFGGKIAWGPEAIVRDDPNFEGRGNPSSGDHFHAAPNIDHSQDFVRRDIKEWMKWLRTEIGFDGWRLDFVKGFWGGYVKEYIEATSPAFAIGEYWDSLAYEGGNVCYNQDAHRQRIINWINATGGTSSAFDVTTKGILHAALHNEYWRLIDPQGKPPGVMGWWPSRAVTFLENHDTGSTQGHWPFPRDKVMQGYAYILTHPGTPVIFYDHFYDFGLHDTIAELIAVRTGTGVHCRSPIRIYQANNQGYAAQIGDSLIMKIGPSDWNPLRKNNLAGNWCRVVDKGLDYQIWRKT
eukprot:c29097_g1_i3 orf=478-3477(+)